MSINQKVGHLNLQYTMFKRFLEIMLHRLSIPWWWMFCSLSRVRYDPSWRFLGVPRIYTCHGRGTILIGRSFIVCSRMRSNSIGVIQPVLLRCGPAARLIIGNHVGISGCTISASKSIEIGNHVLIGSGCLITDSDAHPVDPSLRRSGESFAVGRKPIRIEDDVFIGARVIILKGVTIGQGSVIGAGAVVSSDVPPYCIAAGNPAKIIGHVKRDGNDMVESLVITEREKT